MVKEQDAPEVYLLFGNARFHIGSPDELVALGLSWAQVVTVPDGALAPFARVPVRGTLVRDRTAPEVWLSLGTVLWWVPSSESMRFLGLDWAQVHIVPAGSLAVLPQVRPESASATPSSVVFPPNNPERWARNDVPGISLPNGSRVVELRGWLTAVDSTPNPKDPDWHYQLDVDPGWLDHIGANWSTFWKVGDILMMGENLQTDPKVFDARVAKPTVHLETNGWRNSNRPGTARPDDWAVQAGGLADVIWPYLPTASGGSGQTMLQKGQYVRVIGSIISDIPHEHGQGEGVWEFLQLYFQVVPGFQAYDIAQQDWGGSRTEQDEAHPGRWTEIHPPDLIVIAENPPPVTEAVFGVALVARAAVIDPIGPDREITVDLRPPSPRPLHTKAAIREYVGPETRYGSIVEGNPARNGAAITLYDDRATIHIKVHADGFGGPAGTFKAIYRLTWAPDPHSFTMIVSTQPASVSNGTPTTVTFVCTDSESGASLDGQVSYEGKVIGPTNTPITATFRAKRVRIWEPGDPNGVGSQRIGHWVWDDEPPAVLIDVSGYVSTTYSISTS